MGQQQLLLIVLGVILVGIAIIVGISLFNHNAVDRNRDAVISELNQIGTLAIQYYKTPASMSGGNQSFIGWQLPANYKNTVNGSYTATVKKQSVKLVGKGTELSGNNKHKVQATATVSPISITVVVNY